MSTKSPFYSLTLHNVIFHHQQQQHFIVSYIHHNHHSTVSFHQHDQHRHKINAVVVERSKEGCGAKQCKLGSGKENRGERGEGKLRRKGMGKIDQQGNN